VFDARNYRVNSAIGDSRDIKDKFWTGDFEVFRRINAFPFPASIQLGGLIQEQARSMRFENNNYTYTSLNGDVSLVPVQSKVFGTRNLFGFSDIPWASPNITFDLWQDNPELLTRSAAQKVTDRRFKISRSQYIQEKVTAYYFQTELHLLNNRLQVLTGVRYEKTNDKGRGPLFEPGAAFLRNASGNFVLDSNGQRVRRPEAGAAGSIEELEFTSEERGFKAANTYDGYYPSLHLTFNARENLLVRAAYAKTYGRPDFAQILPTAQVNENDLGSVIPGTITVSNTSLQPWSADNYDLSIEYYSASGGVISGGVFLKDIKNFFGTRAIVATEADLNALSLPTIYTGWTVATTINSGDARVLGFEFNFKQSLSPFFPWGKHLTLMANATKLDLDGGSQADFSSFIAKSANWGIAYNRERFTVMALWNYRGQEAVAPRPQMGPGGYDYIKARIHLDLNADFQLSPRLFAFVAVKNTLNAPQTRLRYGSETPGYAKTYQLRSYGALFSFGVRGTF